MQDSRGNELAVGDRIRFISWGYNVALGDTQGTHEVVGFGTSRVRVRISTRTDGKVKAVRTSMVTKVDAKGKAVGKPKPLVAAKPKPEGLSVFNGLVRDLL